MVYLLDTNHCSKLLDKDPEIIEKLIELADEKVLICVIVRGELQFMVENSEYKEENRRKLSNFLKDIDVYLIDDAVADIYGSIKAALFEEFGPRDRRRRRKYKLKKLGVDENDLWIAAVAKRNGFRIVSADKGFKRIAKVEELEIESWIPKATN